MSAAQIFNELKKQLHESAEKRATILALVTKLGMEKLPSKHTVVIRDEYVFEDPDLTRVRLVYKNYDPSGPFQNLPDIVKYDLYLEKDDETLATEQLSFEE